MVLPSIVLIYLSTEVDPLSLGLLVSPISPSVKWVFTTCPHLGSLKILRYRLVYRSCIQKHKQGVRTSRKGEQNAKREATFNPAGSPNLHAT